MIDYSLGLRLLNPGNTDSEKKIFANAQMRQVLTLQKFAKHISSHGSPYSRDVVVGVLTATVDCLREMLLEGYKVQLGELGAFYVTFTCEGVEKAEDFNPQNNIEKVNVRWEKGANFADMKKDAEFNFVPTRKQQADEKKENKAALTEAVANGTSGSETSGGGTNPGGSDNPGGGDVTE